jgi:hypothetical protein
LRQLGLVRRAHGPGWPGGGPRGAGRTPGPPQPAPSGSPPAQHEPQCGYCVCPQEHWQHFLVFLVCLHTPQYGCPQEHWQHFLVCLVCLHTPQYGCPQEHWQHFLESPGLVCLQPDILGLQRTHGTPGHTSAQEHQILNGKCAHAHTYERTPPHSRRPTAATGPGGPSWHPLHLAVAVPLATP